MTGISRRTAMLMGVLAWAAACDEGASPDAGPRDTGAGVDAGPPPTPWPMTLSDTASLGTRRGRRFARTVVHLHSPLSHDACDGAGWIDGTLADPGCLGRLRDSMCALRLDAAMLTDHAPHLDEVAFEDALWMEGDDEAVLDTGGAVVANRMACGDGHRVLLTVGSENALMPLGLDRHVIDTTDPDALRAAYDQDGAEGADAFRAAGALVWQAHTEGRPLEALRAIGLDGLEIYNLHANLDPTIREQDLGLEPASYTSAVLDFANPRLDLTPDLAVLAFLSENRNALDKFDALLAEGARIAGSGGCDSHENVLPMELSDGERADSYRRTMYWILNHLLVDDVSPEGVEEALAAGRFFVVFEIFGTPVGLDFLAASDQGGVEVVADMGDTAPVGAVLRLSRPSLPAGWPAEPPPVISMRIVRSTAAGAEEVASGDAEILEHVATVPGAYRAEVHVVPEHARPHLGRRADLLIREVPWVYSNPIFVE